MNGHSRSWVYYDNWVYPSHSFIVSPYRITRDKNFDGWFEMKETTRTKIVNWLRDNPKRLPVPKSWIIEQLSKSLNLSHDYLNNLLTTMNVEGLIKIKPFRSNHEWTSLVVLSEYVTEGFNIANSKQLEDWWYNEGKVLFEKLKG